MEVSDPISFKLQEVNTSNTVLEGNLLDINTDLTDGLIQWNNDSLDFTNVTNGFFRIDMNSPFIDNPGTLLAEFKDSLLIRSEDSGRFDGWLPVAGSSGMFSVTKPIFTPELVFDLNLPDFEEEVNLTLGFSTNGEASEAIPEPSSTLSLLAFCTLGVGSMLKRTQKQKSTEKETTKVG